MAELLTAEAEMNRLASRSAARLVEVIRRVAKARVEMDAEAYQSAMADAVDLFAAVLAFSDLLGRRRMQLLYERAEAVERERSVLSSIECARLGGDAPLLPQVEQKSAIRDILSRFPVLARGWRAVQEVYQRVHAFACARSMDIAVTERVQTVLAEAVRTGRRGDATTVLREIGNWSQAYADTVYETTVATAYSKGMTERMADPEIALVLPGMRFVSALLVTTRPNHRAAHGLIAPSDSSLWTTFTPPLGYRCLCARREVTIFEAREKDLLLPDGTLMTVYPSNFADAYPDPGFNRGL